MHPVLVSLGNFSISSFGFFLSIAFLLAVFIIWRLCRIYDIDEEQTLDITLLTFFGALIGARLFFVITNFNLFNSFSKMVLINRYPGLNFWGGLIFGFLALNLFVRRFRLHFWQIADFVMVGVFAALIFGSLGCLLGSCQYGIVSSFPLTVPQVGVLENRFPVQILSSIFYFFSFLYLWKICLRFHYSGKVAAVGFILLGLIKFVTEYFRGDVQELIGVVTVNQVFAAVMFVFGMWIIYTQGRRSVAGDLKFLGAHFTHKRVRNTTLSKLSRSLYNTRINLKVSLARSRKNFISSTKQILRNINVKQNPPQF